jgi:cytochrome P450
VESTDTESNLFDPIRFSPSRAEDEIHVCAWMPFGKGRHTRTGMHFAGIEIKTFIVQLRRQFRFDLTSSTPPEQKRSLCV